MDFMPYAQAYLDRVFVTAGEPVAALLQRYAAGWSPGIGQQFLVQNFDPMPAPDAPPLMPGFAKAHLKALVLSRQPEGLLLAAIHGPSLLRRDIAFEIGIGIGPDGVFSARLTSDPAHDNELCLFLLGMGSLETMYKALNAGRS
jgi:hypothetical protein